MTDGATAKVRVIVADGLLCDANPSFFRPNAVVPDGYGLSYGIGADHIRWTITNVRGNTRDGAELKHYLAEAATEIRYMMENAAKETVHVTHAVVSEPVKIRAKL